MMKKLLMALAAAGLVIGLAACGTATPVRQAAGPVRVLDASAPQAQEKTVKAAPGTIQVLPPSNFIPLRDTLGDIYTAISGNRGVEIFPKDVRVVLPGGVTLAETIPDRTEVSSWITNLPAGLVGHIHEAAGGEKGAREFRILVSGTPTETKKEPVAVTIPGSYLSGGVDLEIETNPNALIDIANATIQVSDVAAEDALPPAWSRNRNTIVIGGSVGFPIIPKTITIRLDHASVPRVIPDETNLSRWITNLPNGLYALASETEKDATEVVLTISGVPTEAIDQAIFVRIPSEELHRALDLVVQPNEDLRFEIYGLSLSNVIVGGAVNNEIVPRTVTIHFGAGKLIEEIAKDANLARWFTNLPAGLRAVATDTTPAGASAVTVTISGTPSSNVDAPILVTVPANVIYEGRAFEVSRNDNARYDVGAFEVQTRVREVEDSENPNWRGNRNWQLNGPRLVEVKDFDAVGVIQITAQSVEEIGPDNDYRWSGDGITYAKLMAEARRLNAHAIINIVVDFEDTITERIERRHVLPGYRLSVEEQAANRRNPNRFVLVTEIDGALALVETTHRTVRVYTGTALAIRYTGAAN
ncbi:MAG: hypothetical protein LBQ35_00720 [Spirochaetaceae bacterium]|jgi:hypothetical protein|nr:hypothetical protein [Spirochaetaceae bacterium]